jgi:hypothetical protein
MVSQTTRMIAIATLLVTTILLLIYQIHMVRYLESMEGVDSMVSQYSRDFRPKAIGVSYCMIVSASITSLLYIAWLVGLMFNASN